MKKYKYLFSFEIKDGKITGHLDYTYSFRRYWKNEEEWLNADDVSQYWFRVALTEEEADAIEKR